MSFITSMIRSLTGLLLSSLIACVSLDAPEPALVKIDDQTVRLTATIRTIEDYVPVDGGVDIVLEDEYGVTHHAHFTSMFTLPPPPQSHVELYTIIQTLRPDDRITITGPLRDSTIIIVSLTRT